MSDAHGMRHLPSWMCNNAILYSDGCTICILCWL